MKMKITKEIALKSIGNNFDKFEALYVLCMNPGEQITFYDRENTELGHLSFGSKNDQVNSEEAYMQAALLTVIEDHSLHKNRSVEFTDEAINAVYEFAICYNFGKMFEKKYWGFTISKEKDEYGLPKYEIDAVWLKEKEKELIEIYGEDWQDKLL